MIVMSIDATTGKVRVSPISNRNPLEPSKNIASILGHGHGHALQGQVFIGHLCELGLTGVKIWDPPITLTATEVENMCKEISTSFSLRTAKVEY